MKLAALALLTHPLLILVPTGIFAATDWGIKAETIRGAWVFPSPLPVHFVLGQQRLRV